MCCPLPPIEVARGGSYIVDADCMKPRAPLIVGRYAIYDRIAAGGMATVHLGRLVGEGGFSRTVAIKRLHAHFAMDPEFVGMFLDEARLAARIRHPNVVQTLDVVVADGEVFLVMDYVEGESLAHLMRVLVARGEMMPPACASALISPALHGLHAAHEAKNDHGAPLGLVHRDVSPQNILVGIDGVPRVLDFGVAKALGQSHSTREGQLKGKLAYMAPEQVQSGHVDRRTDVFAASVVLWEALAGRRLFRAEGEAQVMHLLLYAPIEPPSTVRPGIPASLDALVMRGLSRDPEARFATAEEMADALDEAAPPMPARKLGAWVRTLLGDAMSARARLVHEIESASTGGKSETPESLAATRVAAIDESLDVTVALDPVEEPPPQASSQASSISVEAPRRGSVPPPRSRATLMVVGGGVAICIGALALIAAVRGLGDGKSTSVASDGTVVSSVGPPPALTVVPAATSTPWVPAPPPTPTMATAAPTPSPTATASATPTETAPPRPTPIRRAAPPAQRQPSPDPASTLYSRF
jgi:eukaryotic-like serine/threonine-protein kinase